MQELLLDTHVWYTFSFLIFAALVLKLGMPVLNTFLDQRIAQIQNDLEEAENLRVEAQEMLAQYQRKHRDAVQESAEILEKAKASAEKFRINAENDLQETISRREAQLEDRLKRMEQNAINEIQTFAADLAMNTARQIIIDNLDKKVDVTLIDNAIKNVDANIH
ncbi:MAG: hypothetical protein ACRBDI_01075 [Alphaproteobacteria bacterium]